MFGHVGVLASIPSSLVLMRRTTLGRGCPLLLVPLVLLGDVFILILTGCLSFLIAPDYLKDIIIG